MFFLIFFRGPYPDLDTNIFIQILPSSRDSTSSDVPNIKIFYYEKKRTDDCIYNLDETTLYIKRGSLYSYTSKDTDKKNTKRDKTRITLILWVSMTGEKLEHLVKGRSINHSL